MKKASKSLIVLVLAFLFGSCFGVYSVQAQNDKLNLEVIEQCDIQYAGDSGIAEFKLFNNTGKILDGTAILHIDYQGVCSGNKLENFDGEGIQAWYNNSPPNLDWENGDLTFSNFDIPKGETQPSLKIKTHPALCPGGYTFIFSLKGTFEEEEYIPPPVVIGGVGYIPPIPGVVTTITIIGPPTVTSDSATISLTTDISSYCRIIYDTESHPVLGNPPNYGYTFSTEPPAFRTTSHQITLTNLEPGTTYYYRAVCWASPTKISVEYSFTTLGVKVEEKIEEEIIPPEEEIPTEEVVLVPPAEEIVPPEEVIPPEEEVVPPEELVITPPEERVPGEGWASLLLASLGEIGETPWMAIIVVFCIIGLVIIGIREWELARKKKKQI